MNVNEKMTALADEIRELSGTTTSKSIDAMTSDVDAANAEIVEQAELLEQIVTALEGKTSGSGGGMYTEWIDITALPSVYGDDDDDIPSNTEDSITKTLIIEDDNLVGLVISYDNFFPRVIAYRPYNTTSGAQVWEWKILSSSGGMSGFNIKNVSAEAGVNFAFSITYPTDYCYAFPIYRPAQ